MSKQVGLPGIIELLHFSICYMHMQLVGRGLLHTVAEHVIREKGSNHCSWAGSNLVAIARENPLTFPGSEMWSDRFSKGPLPVTIAWTKNPNMENMACKPHMCIICLRLLEY